MLIHEDNRRKLIEWISGEEFCVSKVVIAKEGCIVGDHHHKNKDEAFFLLSGRANRVVIGENEYFDVLPYETFIVPAETYHLFDLAPGSMLLGTASKPYDPQDEIDGR